MATIGSVLISVYAKTDGLRKSLSKAQKTIGAFAKKAVKILKTISVSIGVGAVAGITAVIAVVNKYAAEIDKMAKTSKKLGVTVAALQKLQYQAELTGVSSKTLNMALQRMVRRVSEAAKGTGAAKDALKELGISAEYLNKLSPDKQFYAISESMKSISNQGDKVRIAMKIFDTEGVSLVNTMNSSLDETGKHFDALGISVTESGARMVEAYQDSKTKMNAIFSGFGLKLTEQLAAPFKKLIEWVSKTIIDMGGMGSAAKKFASFIISGIKSSVSALQTLIKSFVKLENLMLRIENIKLLPSIAAEAVASQVAGTPGLVGYNTQKAFDNDAQRAKNNAMVNDNSAIKRLDDLLLSLNSSIGDVVESTSDSSNATQQIIRDTKDNIDATSKATKQIESLAKSTKVATDNNIKMAESAVMVQTTLQRIALNGGGTKTIKTSADSTITKTKPLKGLGYSVISGSGDLRMDDYIKSAQNVTDIINSGSDAASTAPSTRITLNMVTDAGKVTGELLGSQEFINEVEKLQNAKANKEARMVTN